MRKFIRKTAAAFAAAAFTALSLAGYYENSLPDYLMTDSSLDLQTFFDVTAALSDSTREVSTQPPDVQTYTLSLFGAVPVKEVQAHTVDTPMLRPCGEPFGIRLITDGVLVVDLQSQGGFDGTLSCPAARCGIRIGDIIMSVGGQAVSGNSDISAVVEGSGGQPLEVRLKRDGEVKTVSLVPELSGGKYRAGMWVRDSSAGIGTLTFYDDTTGSFGGLGHPICDADTKQPLPLSDGNTGEVDITGVEKSHEGDPGELLGAFRSSAATGVITANTSCGVFGRTFTCPTKHDAMPLGFRQQIHEGDATVYTTVQGGQPQEYSVSIKSIDLSESAEHSMIVEITDPELLDKAGGIVQGMSGSPIMQDGKLIGALTHVFTDDPTCGYAVFAEEMYKTVVNDAS